MQRASHGTTAKDRLLDEQDAYLEALALDPDRQAAMCLERQTDLQYRWLTRWLTYTPLSYTAYHSGDDGSLTDVKIPCGDGRNADFVNFCWNAPRNTGHDFVKAHYAQWPKLASLKVCERRFAWWNKEGRFYEARKWRKEYTVFLLHLPPFLASALTALLHWCRQHGTHLTWPPYVAKRKQTE
jgi:hypothetical protein